MIELAAYKRNFKPFHSPCPRPQLIRMQAGDIDGFRKYTKSNFSFYKLADANMCVVDSSFFKLSINQRMSFTLILRDSSGEICCGGGNTVDVDLLSVPHGHLLKGELGPLSQGHMKVFLTPERRGQHWLSVIVNGTHIKDSPFMVTVHMQLNHLLQPVATISSLSKPSSLVYSKNEDRILASENNKGVSKIDTQFHLKPSEFFKLLGVIEITHDEGLNVVFATTGNDQVHKISNEGMILKSVGQPGKKSAEFNHPNGLRMSKNHELYVCDSGNNRVQIFDQDLNFRRSFGKEGSGKGQFSFPSDVDFDSSGNVYVSDHNNYRIQVFTPNERFIRNLIPINQEPLAKKFKPVSIAMHYEKIYVTDWYSHTLWVMNASGKIIAIIGSGILSYPEGIAIDKAGFMYVTSHFSKIVVFLTNYKINTILSMLDYIYDDLLMSK